MAKQKSPLRYNPNDHFAKAALKMEAVGVPFVETFLPPEIRAHLNLSTPKFSPDRFISEDMLQYYSATVYTCHSNQAEPVRVCILI